MTAPSTDALVQALQRVLGAHHAAVYGYPVIGVGLRDGGQLRRARHLQGQHRQTRDELMAELAGRSISPVPAEPAYTPAEPVTDPTGAQRWALQLEQDCAAAYRYLLATAVLSQQTGFRRQALTGLTTAGERATDWRALLTPSTPTVAFPGL